MKVTVTIWNIIANCDCIVFCIFHISRNRITREISKATIHLFAPFERQITRRENVKSLRTIDFAAKSSDESCTERNIQEAISPMLISLLHTYIRARKSRPALTRRLKSNPSRRHTRQCVYGKKVIGLHVCPTRHISRGCPWLKGEWKHHPSLPAIPPILRFCRIIPRARILKVAYVEEYKDNFIPLFHAFSLTFNWTVIPQCRVSKR